MTLVQLSSDALMQNLPATRLLSSEQLQEVGRIAAMTDPAQPAALTSWMEKKGWLTPWQSQSILEGRTDFHIGKYRLQEELHAGGLGATYKARQGDLGRTVVVKVISRQLLQSPESVTQLHREVHAAAGIVHPHLVCILDADQVERTYFLVSEYVEGLDLAAWQKAFAPLPITWACRAIEQVALALQCALQRGLVHGNLKPSNVIIVTEDEGKPDWLKVLNLGLGRFSRELADQASTTHADQMILSPDYLSPEQAEDSRAGDIRSDLFSVGCILFQLLTGQVPFKGRNATEKILARVKRDAPLASSLRSDVPPGIDAIVAKLLARDPAERYQTPAELVAAFREFVKRSAGLIKAAADASAASGSSIHTGAPATLEKSAAETSKSAAETSKSAAETSKSAVDVANSKSRLPPGLSKPAAAAKPAAGAKSTSGSSAASGSQPSATTKPIPESAAAAAKVLDFPLPKEDAPSAAAAGSATASAASPPAASEEDDYQLAPVEDERVKKQKAAQAALGATTATGLSARDILGIGGGASVAPGGAAKAGIPVAAAPGGGMGSPGGTAAAASGDVRIFQVTDGEPIGKVTSVAFSPNGKFALLGSDFAVSLWDVQTGKLVRRLAGHAGGVTHVAFAPLGRIAVSTGWDGLILLWDLQTGNKLKELQGHSDGVNVAVFSADGKHLLSGSRDRTLRLWEIRTGEVARWLDYGDWVRTLVFMPDGRSAVIGGGGAGRNDFAVRVWDLASAQEIRCMFGHTAEVNRLALTADGRGVASASNDRTVRLWDIAGGREVGCLEGHQGAVQGVVLSADSRRAISCSDDQSIRIWNVVTRDAMSPLYGHQAVVSSLVMSPDGQSILSGGHDQTARLWKLPPPSADYL